MKRKKGTAPAKPHSKVKAAARVLSPNQEWAAKYETKILAALHPYQRAAVEDPGRRVSMLVGRGGGKTTAARARAVIKMMKRRKAKIVYIATTRTQAEELNWGPLKEMLERLGIYDEFSFNESKLRCTCKRTGSTYRMVGADKKNEIGKLRGQPFDEVQIDEGASHLPELLEELIDRIIGPRLGERQGVILLFGTPGHILRGQFYDATRRSSPRHRPYVDRDKRDADGKLLYPEWTAWSSHAWNMLHIMALPNAAKLYPALVANWLEALVEKKDKQWSDENPIWMREYLGLWASDDTTMIFKYRPHLEGEAAKKHDVPDGTAWNQWDPFGSHKLEGIDALKAAIAALPKDEAGRVRDWHFVSAKDMGSKDPFACNLFAFAPTDVKKEIWHVFGFEKRGMYGKPIAELLIGPDLNHEKLAGIMGVIGWPDGMVMDSDQATLDDLAKVYGLQIKKATRDRDYKFGAIELVNGDLVDGRLKIIKGSILEMQMQELQWKPDEFGFMREDKSQANHSTDCVVHGRKLISELFESGVVDSTARPGTNVVYVDPMGLDGQNADPSSEEDDKYLADPEYEQGWGND